MVRRLSASSIRNVVRSILASWAAYPEEMRYISKELDRRGEERALLELCASLVQDVGRD
jgi:hypothetical protein